MSVYHILPLYEAYRMICDVTKTGVSDPELEAWAEAQLAIDKAVQMPWPKRVEELAAQIQIDTSMGDNGLSPAVLQRLKLIVDTAQNHPNRPTRTVVG